MITPDLKCLKNSKGDLVLVNGRGEPVKPIPYQRGMDFRPPVQNANGNFDSGSLGYQYTIQTTTYIRPQVQEQVFYEIPFADYVNVHVGEGAWLEDIKTNAQVMEAGSFESGIVGTSSAPSKVSQVTVGTFPIDTKLATWMSGYTYSEPEISKALAANNWDVIRGKMSANKMRWDLGLQQLAFLGLINDQTNFSGLLTNSQPTVNTTVITQNISSMTPSQFQTLVENLIAAYWANSNNTALPNTLLMPMSDYLGLATFVNPAFPMANSMMIDVLLEAFRKITKNPDFQIEGVAYCDAANNAGYVSPSGKYRYVLYRRGEPIERESHAMFIPVDFTLRPAGTQDNVHWNGIALAQFSGVTILRPALVMYFDHS